MKVLTGPIHAGITIAMYPKPAPDDWNQPLYGTGERQSRRTTIQTTPQPRSRGGQTTHTRHGRRVAIVLLFGVLAVSPMHALAVEHPFCLWTRDEAAQLRKWIETDPVAKEQSFPGGNP